MDEYSLNVNQEFSTHTWDCRCIQIIIILMKMLYFVHILYYVISYHFIICFFLSVVWLCLCICLIVIPCHYWWVYVNACQYLTKKTKNFYKKILYKHSYSFISSPGPSSPVVVNSYNLFSLWKYWAKCCLTWQLHLGIQF